MRATIKSKRYATKAKREAHRIYQAKWKKAHPEQYAATQKRMLEKYVRLRTPRLYLLPKKKRGG